MSPDRWGEGRQPTRPTVFFLCSFPPPPTSHVPRGMYDRIVQVKNVFEPAILGEMSATLGQLYIMPFGAAEPKKDAVPQKTD